MFGPTATDRRALDLERRLDVLGAGGPAVEAAADPYSAGWLTAFLSTNAGPGIECGFVIDALPAAHAYRVSTGVSSVIWCTAGGSGGGSSYPGGVPPNQYYNPGGNSGYVPTDDRGG
jgi:hypothetical protein